MGFINVKYIPKPDTVAAFGCDTKEQLKLWRPEICGVCCLKMIGDTKNRTTKLSPWQLTQACLEQGAFKAKSGKIQGIYHRPMVEVARAFGLHGFTLPRVSLLLARFLLMLRITPIMSIDLHKFNPKYEVGHLIVIVGYDSKGKAYIIHDPSSVLATPGKFARLSSRTLRSISNNRGVVLF
jgi:hypothetical protein